VNFCIVHYNQKASNVLHVPTTICSVLDLVPAEIFISHWESELL